MSEDLTKLNLVQLLDLLEPIPEPAPVSLWPQTQGWLWLAVALLAAAAWLVRRLVMAYRVNAYRRAALKEIRAAGESPAMLADILRRTALAAYPRSDVAGLHGEEWLAFLDASYRGSQFRSGVGRVLATAAYRPAQPVEGLQSAAVSWVRGHNRANGKAV